MTHAPNDGPFSGDSRDTNDALLSGLRLSKDESRRRECQAEFFTTYKPRLVAFFQKRGVSNHDAEDLGTELTVSLIESMKTFKYDPQARFRSYLYTSARRAIGKFWTRNRLRQIAQGAYLEQRIDVQELHTRLDEQIDLDLLEEAKRRVRPRVSDRDWSIFERRTIGDVKAGALASILGTTPGAIYEATRRVKKELMDEVSRLSEQRIDEG